jgi:hypothetical protein
LITRAIAEFAELKDVANSRFRHVAEHVSPDLLLQHEAPPRGVGELTSLTTSKKAATIMSR